MALVQQFLRNSLSIATGSKSRREARFVEFNGDFSFFSLSSQIWQQRFENVDAALSANLSHKQVPVFFRILPISGCVGIERQIEVVAHRLNGSRVGHFDAKRKDVSWTLAPVFIVRPERATFDRNAAFTVNKSSKISEIFVSHAKHGITKSYQKPGPHQRKSANSANTRPFTTRATPSQISQFEKVCREHIRTPKGMTCSELRSNAKRTAEMTVPGESRVTTLQDAKVAQIQWYGASGVTNRRKHGVDSDIDTTVTS